MAKVKTNNQVQAKPNRSQRRTQKMQEEFPSITKQMLWNRKRHDGFATVPRTMPLVMKIINDKSENGQPAGHTLFCLWMRAMDHPYLVIDKPKIYALETGLIGERAESTWRKRMDTLRKLGFIAAKEGAGGPFHHVVLLNPNVAVVRMHAGGQVQALTWGFFKERAEEIGALSEIAEAQQTIKEEKEASLQAAKKPPRSAIRKRPVKQKK